MGYNIRSVSHYRAPVGYNIALVGLLCYPGGLLYYPGLLFYLRGQLPGAPATYSGIPSRAKIEALGPYQGVD